MTEQEQAIVDVVTATLTGDLHVGMRVCHKSDIKHRIDDPGVITDLWNGRVGIASVTWDVAGPRHEAQSNLIPYVDFKA